MLISNLFFIIFSLPNYIFATLINLFFIINEKLINLKNLKKFFSKNLSIFYILFLVLIFYNNFLDFEFIIRNQYYIILLSLIYYFNFTKRNFEIEKIFWFLSIIYFFYIISLIFFNNLILSCVISNNGFFDFFSVVNNELIIFNTDKFNCDSYYLKGIFEHQSNFKFKIFIFLLINSLSLIINVNDKKKLYINIFFQIYLNAIVFSLSSRGLGLVYLFTNIVIIYFLIKKNKKLHSSILISFFVIFSSIFYLKSVELVNIFYFKNLSVTQQYITRQNLFHKFNIHKYKYNSFKDVNISNLNDLRQNAIKAGRNKYLSFNYYGKDTFSLKSDRWKEYRSFFNIFYKKYILNQSSENFNSYYHNFYMNEFARLGFSSFFLTSYIFLLNLINFKSSLNTKKIDNICLSVIYLSIFFYVSLFDAFLAANLRNLILLIIILFILNKYNEKNAKKI